MDKILILNVNNFDKAKKFVKKANIIDGDIGILTEKYVLDAKSSLGIYTMDLSRPITVQIVSNNKDEIKLFNEIMEEFK